MAKPLALTSGEPAGIGPDITIKAWLRRNELKLPAFYLRGDRDLISDRADRLGLKVRLADVAPEDACKRPHGPASRTTPARTPPWPPFVRRSAT